MAGRGVSFVPALRDQWRGGGSHGPRALRHQATSQPIIVQWNGSVWMKCSMQKRRRFFITNSWMICKHQW